MFNRIKNMFSGGTKLSQFINYYKRGVEWSNWDSQRAIKEGFESSVWVYACVKKRMDAVSSVPLVVEVKKGDQWEVDSNHQLQQLIDNPNPEMNQTEFVRFLMAHMDLDGNFYALKVRGGEGDRTRELYPVLPYDMKPWIGEGSRYVEKYYFSPNGTYFQPEDIYHQKYVNPDSFAIGACPLKAAGKAVDIDNAAGAFQKISMQQRGIPDGVFTIQDMNTKEQFDEAKKLVKEQYANMGSAREPWVMGNGTFTPMSRTPVEMDFINTRNFSKEEICSAYNTPSELISGMGDANRASAETTRRLFWQDTIIPLLDGIVDCLNNSVAIEYGTLEEVRFSYDLSQVQALQENLKDTLENAKSLWSMGVPFDMINQKLGLGFDQFEGSEIGYIPSSLLPSDTDISIVEEEKAYNEDFNIKAHEK